jgi:hypothetical protein
VTADLPHDHGPNPIDEFTHVSASHTRRIAFRARLKPAVWGFLS